MAGAWLGSAPEKLPPVLSEGLAPLSVVAPVPDDRHMGENGWPLFVGYQQSRVVAGRSRRPALGGPP
jgi:hypothetical protein